MNKTEWPTSAKLENLRETGEVPLSSISLRAGAIVGLVLGLYFVHEQWESALGSNVFSLLDTSSPGDRDSFFHAITSLVIVPLLFSTAVVFLIGLLQTKFFFSLARCAIDVRRVNPLRLPSLSRIIMGLGRDMGGFMIALAVTLLLLWFGLPRLLVFFNYGEQHFQGLFWSVLRLTVWGIVGICVIGAVVGYALQRASFMMRHRMTKREVEAEGRE